MPSRRLRYQECEKYCAQHAGKCVPQETAIYNVRLAAAYIAFQRFCAVFGPAEALAAGTAFPELLSPYKGCSKPVWAKEGYRGG